MGLEDLWDDFKDGFVSTFENMGEFSMYGIVFGIIGVAILLITKPYMLDSFTKLMKPGSAILVTILTFVVTFATGYILGHRMENN